MGCDTLVALREATADGSAILAKNSDRPADESQPLSQSARLNHRRGATVKCQYLEIPQVEETLGFIGSRPYWLWGLEQGMNERGVAIGNEAVFTREALPEVGLLGMDLVRLGLERGHTAAEALDVTTRLIVQFGQGGSAYEHVQWGYSNSFIIADPSEAYILETSGREFAWRKVRAFASISNHIAIGSDWDGMSPGARKYAESNGWWRRADASERFDFSGAYRSTETVPAEISEERLRQSRKLLGEKQGRVSSQIMMRILRDHYENGTVFTPGREPSDGKCYSICMHADPVGTTAASMVAHIRTPGRFNVYWAGLGNPCCGVFMPLYTEGEIPRGLTRAGSHFSDDSMWWLFKKLDECVAEDYRGRTPVVQSVWSELEAEFMNLSVSVEAEALRYGGNNEKVSLCLTQFMAENLDKVLSRLRELLAEFH